MKKGCILFVICGLLATHCHKKEGQPVINCPPCPLEIANLKFRLIDKQTGQDYFFSNPPKYPITALHVRAVQDTADSPVYADSNDRYFIILPSQEAGSYFYQLSIDGLKPDTVQFGLEFASTNAAVNDTHSCCGREFYIGQILLDGQSEPDEISDTAVLEIKK